MKAVLLFAILALAANVATATHFRYMTMSWSRSSSSSLEVKVKLQAAFRAGFWTNSPLTVGQTVSGVGNVDFGNGNAAVPIALRVTSYNGNTAEPWFIGESEVSVSYDDPDQFTVIWSDCCRIAGLEDGNSEQYYTVVMTLDLTSSLTQSAQVTQFPLMYFNLNKANNIQLPFLTDSNAASPAFTIRTAGTGLTTAQPAGLTVSSNGVVNWTPTKIGLYAIQFAATTPGSSLPLDLILSVVQATNDPPSIDAPTVTSITFVPGTVVTFPVVGSDPDSGDTVTITSTSLPNGASLSTCTPAQVCNEVFSWPTNAATTSAIVCFQAADDKGNNSAQKCVTLVPDSNNPCPSGTIGGAGCVSKTISNKCVGHGFNTVTESAGGCATIAFDPFGTGC